MTKKDEKLIQMEFNRLKRLKFNQITDIDPKLLQFHLESEL